MGGILPFGCVFIQLFFILNSIWSVLCLGLYVSLSLCMCVVSCLRLSMSMLDFSLHLFLRGHKMYYVFGFLMLVFIILVITTIESTILLCYFHLCAEVCHLHHNREGSQRVSERFEGFCCLPPSRCSPHPVVSRPFVPFLSHHTLCLSHNTVLGPSTTGLSLVVAIVSHCRILCRIFLFLRHAFLLQVSLFHARSCPLEVLSSLHGWVQSVFACDI